MTNTIEYLSSQETAAPHRYVIYSPDEDGYWSHSQGWVALEEAGRFTEAERRSVDLPIGGGWVAVTGTLEEAARSMTIRRVIVVETWDFSDIIDVLAASDDDAADLAEAIFKDQMVTWDQGQLVERTAEVQSD